jgi:hypothetical protein
MPIPASRALAFRSIYTSLFRVKPAMPGLGIRGLSPLLTSFRLRCLSYKKAVSEEFRLFEFV